MNGSSQREAVFRRMVEATRRLAGDTHILYVTNRIDRAIRDYKSDGLNHSSQYYTDEEIAITVDALQGFGFRVSVFHSERDFFQYVLALSYKENLPPNTLAVTTAEGGIGESRRALIPSFCAYVGLRCWNSTAHACTVARHKFHSNRILSAAGIRVPRTWLFRYPQNDWISERKPDYGTKIIVKPVSEGGSIGIDKDSIWIFDERAEEFIRERSQDFRQSCVAQEFKFGYEVGFPIICIPEPMVTVPVGYARGEALKYGAFARTFEDEKMTGVASNFPFADLDARQLAALEKTAKLAFDILGLSGLARIDMRVDEDGNGWVFDTNESPPPLPRSAFVKSLQWLGLTFEEALGAMVGSSLLREARPHGIGRY